MKRKITAGFLFLILLFTFISCGKEPGDVTADSGAPTIEMKEAFVKPQKREHTAEDQKIIDRYYEEMVLQYPKFGAIPRDMLQENFYQVSGEPYFSVTFTFCFGGLPTNCRCTFDSSPRFPDGQWNITEDTFSQFYQSGLDETVMKQIRTTLWEGVAEYIDTYHLKKMEVSAEMFPIYWRDVKGTVFAFCEYIAETTGLTTKSFGCGDHAHIFGKVQVEPSDGSAQLIFSPVSGS